mmetsp:Transcript_29996/g.72030  ORF Transcript_29996/g.72030 Transcript_29996/m.72030 type:complete len:549 (+) Transcript_29996:98-1744(+)|eukprot:CAMPEP_0113634108 /NCGR_PEP_ID=MMETSP0017_2-20120614/17758_1 /TAXON_ID=2856 /ORGANISM="Cylindrotheca closterium" /LENGTH=548 /DNA_ID=CAMNT_0000544789 /DNA_START=41 /DNA_END=1687 /DNA_ORIENTATION=- /assembly_acc=CAM_ASM_000147
MESSTSSGFASATTAALPPSAAAPSSSTSTTPATAAATVPAPAVASLPSANQNDCSPRKSFLEAQEEGVLNDVLEELDRERTKRAELEARVRELEQNLHTEKRKNTQSSNFSAKDYMSLKAEAGGYLELLNALTQDRPAFSTKQKLPVHILRMLEIIPWDPRARPHLFAQEQVYEWQMYRSDKTWQKELRYFPVFFKTLPIVNPAPGRTVNETPSSASPPKQCVLTNLEMSQIVNIDKGYPLPQDGGDWQWIGGWRIEKTGDTDEKGWSYSNSFEIASASSSSYYSELRIPDKGTRNIIKRRRKWTRSRVMIDYPQASEMTKEYLKLVAEKATLDVSLEKLSNQLVDTKMSLTTLEAEHLSLHDELKMQKAQLEKEIAEKNKILELLDVGSEELVATAGIDSDGAAKDDSATNPKAQVKELRSVVTQWVSNTVSKKQSGEGGVGEMAADDATATTAGTTIEDSTNNASNAVSRQIMFDSLRGKGRDLLENIKAKGGDEIERIKQAGAIERIKQTGVKSLWQTKEEDNTENKSRSGSIDITEENSGQEV